MNQLSFCKQKLVINWVSLSVNFFEIEIPRKQPTLLQKSRAGNSLIGFLSESVFFCKKLANKSFAQKMSESLIRSFLVSDLSKSLMVAQFWWATWAICSHCSFLCATWAILSHRSPKMREWANWSFFKIKTLYKIY